MKRQLPPSSTMRHFPGMAAALLVVSGFALTNQLAHADVVWNVNIGNNIDEDDNYIGAAPENTLNSTWNSLIPDVFGGLTLADSTGSVAAGVTVAVISNSGSPNGYSNTVLTTGDEIFVGWTKSSNNSTPFTLALGNLDSGATYDLIIYSDWFWDNGNSGLPVMQTAGAGLEGTFFINRDSDNDAKGLVGPLLEDVDPANSDVGKTNYHRFTGLTPEVGGALSFSMGGINGPLSGFQLIEVAGGANLEITAIDYVGGASPMVTLTWPKTGAASYDVKYSLDLIDWNTSLDPAVEESDDENTGDAENITVTFPLTGELETSPAAFFRIEE